LIILLLIDILIIIAQIINNIIEIEDHWNHRLY